jgi:rod shape-determining protein MreD
MIRQVIYMMGLLLCVIIFQTLLAGPISIGHARPDVVVIMIVWLTITRDLTWGLAFGFTAGLLQDSHSSSLFGLGALLKTLSAVAVFLVSNRVRTDSLLIRVGIATGAVLIHDLFYHIIAFNFDMNLVLINLVNIILPSAIYSAAVSAMIFYLSGRRLVLRFES